MDEEIATQLAIRDRYRRAVALRESPEQRLERMWRLQESMWHLLKASPKGYQHFLRRNFRARAIDVKDPRA